MISNRISSKQSSSPKNTSESIIPILYAGDYKILNSCVCDNLSREMVGYNNIRLSYELVTGFSRTVSHGTYITVQDLKTYTMVIRFEVPSKCNFAFNMHMSTLSGDKNNIIYTLLLDKSMYDNFRNSYDENNYLLSCSANISSVWQDTEMYDITYMNDIFRTDLTAGEYILVIDFYGIETFTVTYPMAIKLTY